VVTQTYNLTIQPVAALCSNGPSVALVPSVAGGVFSGTGVSGNTFNPTSSGVGTFNISYAMMGNSCTIPASRSIVVNPVPTVNAGADITILLGNAGTLWGTASAGTYLWSPTTELSLPTELITRANPMTTTTYKLTATNGFGCKVSDDVVVNVVIPCVDPSNVFTPNNDGFYDKWNVYNGSCVKNIEVDVYNRWGGLVFHSDRYMNDWDGNSKNKPLPDGTYYYMIKATLVGDFKSTLKGNVTIMR
jgi:gliding motility-associated-like protein